MTAFLNRYFSSDDVNRGRQKELDIAKGFAIIFMVWEHALGKFNVTEWGFSANLVVNFLAGPFAASVFMFTMGMGIAYSKRADATTLLKRGVNLYLIGMVLNIFRFFIPEVINALFLNKGFDTAVFTNMLSVDILQFAGLAFLFIGVTRYFQLSNPVMLGLTLACSLIGSFVTLAINNTYLANLIGLIIPTTSEEVIFPFVNWIIFPVVGLIFGQYFLKLKNKDKFYKEVGLPLFIVACLYMGYSYATQTLLFGSDNSYFFMSSLSALFILALVVGWIAVIHLTTHQIDNVISRFFIKLSQNINTIYCIHWTLIGIGSVLFTMEMGTPTLVTTAFIILLLSYISSHYWTKRQKLA